MTANSHDALREGAEVMPFQPGDDWSREIVTVPRDASYEHALDEDAPGASRSTTATASPYRHSAGEQLPVVLEHLQTCEVSAAPSGSTSTPPGSTPELLSQKVSE